MIFPINDDDECVKFSLIFIYINHVSFDFEFIKIIIDVLSVKHSKKKATEKLTTSAKRNILLKYLQSND